MKSQMNGSNKPMLLLLKRYLHGWRIAYYYASKARRKKHGAGKQRWLHVWRGAMCARYLVDGQHRGARGPSFFYKGQKW